jgi:hypothetical protein
MPRRPPRASAIQAANTFVHILIAESKSDDHIIPKNGAYAIFGGVHMRALLGGGRAGDRWRCRACCEIRW